MVFECDKMIRVVHCRLYLIRFIAVQSVFGAIYLISLTVKNDQNVLNSDFKVPELAKVLNKQKIKLKNAILQLLVRIFLVVQKLC